MDIGDTAEVGNSVGLTKLTARNVVEALDNPAIMFEPALRHDRTAIYQLTNSVRLADRVNQLMPRKRLVENRNAPRLDGFLLNGLVVDPSHEYD